MTPGSAGLLPEEAYLGEHPPTTPDYLDDAVSTLAYLPTNQKIIVIQGLQLTPFG